MRGSSDGSTSARCYNPRATKRGSSYRVAVYASGERAYVTVRSKADAEALVREIHRQELAGVDVLAGIKSARTTPTTKATRFPTLRDALDEWIDGQVKMGELRESTAKNYRRRLRV